MAGFAEWLEKLDRQDPDPEPLQTFAINNSATWPRWSNEFAQYRQVITTSTTSAPAKEELLLLLGIYHERWRADAQKLGFRARLGNAFLNGIGTIGLLLFGLVVAGILAYGLNKPDFFGSLAKTDQARGLITFLFAFSATGVIILIAIAIFWLPKDEVENRYKSAKDLLAVVIGVLGTIIGFYFGSATIDRDGFTIANVATSVSVATRLQSVDISARIRGGTAPYRYTITFSDPTGTIKQGELSIAETKTETGGIFQTIKIPENAVPTDLVFVIIARDATGMQTQATGVLSIEVPAREEPKPNSEQSSGQPAPPAPPEKTDSPANK